MVLGRRAVLGLGALAPLAACGAGPRSGPVGIGGGRSGRMADMEVLGYGDDPSQFAELTRPRGTPRGAVVVLHGGFWKSAYDVSLARPLAADLAGRGWACLAVEYRRVGPDPGGGGGFPATLDDVSAAIDLLAGTGLDLDHVLTLGHSAGGHLAAWAAGRQRLGRWADARVAVTGVVAQAGVLDLSAALRDRLGSDAVAAFFGDAAPSEGELAAADPTRRLPLDVPVRCVHGREDVVVPLSQSEEYVDRARAAGADADLTVVEGDHFVVIDPADPSWSVQLGLLDGLV